MKRKIRYLLIAIGVVIFIFFVPLIVFFVHGWTFDLKTLKITETGILRIKTDPETLEIYLDNKLKSTSEKDIRFIIPKTYNLKLKKTGYFDWENDVSIEANKITSLPISNKKIYLIKNNSKINTIATKVQNFKTFNKKIVLIHNDEIIYSDNYEELIQNKLVFKIENTATEILSSSDFTKFLFLDSAKKNIWHLDIQTQKITNLSTKLTDLPEFQNFTLTNENQILFLQNNTLYKFSVLNLKTDIIDHNIAGFYLFQNQIYTYKNLPDKSAIIEESDINLKTKQTIQKNLSSQNKVELFITKNKLILYTANNNLYEISATGERLISKIEQLFPENINNNNQIAFSNLGEIKLINEDGEIKFITRISKTYKNIKLLSKINYMAILMQDSLILSGLDSTNSVNAYEIFKDIEIKKFEIDNEENALLLIKDDLIVLNFR